MKVVLSFANGLRDPADPSRMPCFYEAFRDGLLEAGNDVLVFHGPWGEEFEGGPRTDGILAAARRWGPDAVIAFNNYGPDWAAALDCPVVVYEVDSPLYYANRERIRQRPDRYLYFVMQERSRSVLIGDFGVARNRVFMTTHFTEIRPEKRPMDRNIVFIGSRFFVSREGNPWDLFMRRDPSPQAVREFSGLVAALRENPYLVPANLVERFPLIRPDTSLVHDLVFALSMEKRVQTLSAVADLGLELYGTDEWTAGASECADLTLSFRARKIVTVRQNQDLYNSSKLCLNVNHLQATDSFSWRVLDIMASNGCLVAEHRPDLDRMFPQVKLPVFRDRYEAREQCKRLLADESLRQDIVAASQEAVSGYRFVRVLKLLEETLGQRLGQGAARGGVTYLDCPERVECPPRVFRPLAYRIRRRMVGLIPVKSVRRRMRKDVDFELEVFTTFFGGTVLKKAAMEVLRNQVECLVLGSSHAVFGYYAEGAEFNLADVSADLRLNRELLSYWLERGMSRLKRVVVFFDVFSPGNVMERSSEGFRIIPYVRLYGFDRGHAVRTDTSIGCDYAFAARAFDRYAPAFDAGDVIGYRGNPDKALRRSAVLDAELGHRVECHLKLAKGDEMTHLRAMREQLAPRGAELVIVLPPLRRDYLDELARRGYDWRLARESLSGYSVCDLHDSP